VTEEIWDEFLSKDDKCFRRQTKWLTPPFPLRRKLNLDLKKKRNEKKILSKVETASTELLGIRVTKGRCYDHNFRRFSTIFGEKNGELFLKKITEVGSKTFGDFS
jgi:hypothetical protein